MPRAPSTAPPETEEKTRPIRQIRIGRITGSIWSQQGSDDRIFYNVTFQRLYRRDDVADGENEWGYSDSFGRRDLLELGKVADQCHTWIVRQEHKDRAEQREADAEHDGGTPF